jgi:TonB-dependent receptor
VQAHARRSRAEGPGQRGSGDRGCGLALGEAQAINEQRTSDNILDVMPEGVIQSLPNENIADVVGRMPGVSLERDEGEGKYVQIRGTEPRLNNTTIDGVELPAPEDNVRQFKLDTIPSDIVEAVEVNKTLAANQDADAIGGTVNLVTKKAGELPTLKLESIGGFTPIVNTRYMGLVMGTVGQRFGHDKRFGALISASYDYNGRGIDDIEPSLNDTPSTPTYNGMDIREYRYQRKRYGFRRFPRLQAERSHLWPLSALLRFRFQRLREQVGLLVERWGQSEIQHFPARA